jgi:hypothetical protein
MRWALARKTAVHQTPGTKHQALDTVRRLKGAYATRRRLARPPSMPKLPGSGIAVNEIAPLLQS